MSGESAEHAREVDGRHLIDRVAEILTALGESGGEAGAAEVARRVGIDRRSVHRILQRLTLNGLAAHNAERGTFQLGWRLLELGIRVQEQLPIRHEARPTLEALRDLTGETASLLLAVGDMQVGIDQVPSRSMTKRYIPLGQGFSLNYGAGRIILAFETEAFVDRYLRRLRLEMACDDAPPGLAGGGEAFQAQLARDRRVGYAVNLEETSAGTNSMAFAIVNAAQRVLGSISIVGPSERWTEELMHAVAPRCAELVERLADRLRYLQPLDLGGPAR